MWYAIFRLIIKELQAVLGNWQGRLLLIMPIILQTAIFPFAATLEVKNNTLAIYNQDNGAASRELIQRFAQMSAFSEVRMLYHQAEIEQVLENQQALLTVQISADFSRKLQQGQSGAIQVIVDGRRSNSGQIAAAYLGQVVNTWQQEKGVFKPAQKLEVRHVFNPNLIFRWHVLPSLVCIITTIGCLVVTALSVAREREEGTFDQLLVSPLTPAHIMCGKAVPGMLIAALQGCIIAGAAVFVYGVPFSGSVPVLLLGMLCYGLALAGIGLFISSLCNTQQQAFLGVFCFMVPAVILSGYVSPLENMPAFFQALASINPLTWFIYVLKGVFLKSFGFAQAMPLLWPLMAIAAVTMSAALFMFRRHIA